MRVASVLQFTRNATALLALIVAVQACGQAGNGALPKAVDRIGPAGAEIGTDVRQIAGDVLRFEPFDAHCLKATTPPGVDGADGYLFLERDQFAEVLDLLKSNSRFFVAPNTDKGDAYIFDSSCFVSEDDSGGTKQMTRDEVAASLGEAVQGSDKLVQKLISAGPLETYLATPGALLEVQARVRVGDKNPKTKILLQDFKIASMEVPFGVASAGRLEELLAAMEQRYPLIHPSDAELDDFDSGRRECIAYSTADRSAAIVLRTYGNGEDGISVIYSMASAPPTTSYLEASCMAAEVRGKLSGADL